MRGHRLWLLPAVLIVLSVAALHAEVRTWTDNTGKHKVRAEYVSYAEGKVTLRRSNGKQVEVPLTRLSREDQQYVREQVRKELEEKKAQEEKEKEEEEPLDDEPIDEVDDELEDEPIDEMEDDLEDEPATDRDQDEEDVDEDEFEDEDESPQRPAAQTEADDEDLAPVESPSESPSAVGGNILNSVRGAVYRAQTLNNLKQISLALVNYASQRDRFPPSSVSRQRGQTGLSWRVAILPFMGENNLYRQFRLNEPWDSAHNRKLIPQMPKEFLSPGIDAEARDGYTNYLAIAGSDTVISLSGRGTRLQDIRDGTSNTIMVVEADDDHAVIWTRPQDLEWDSDDPSAGLGHIWSGHFFAALADGSCRRIFLSVGPETLRGLFTRNGGETVRLED
jgi:hypothetical protein